MPMQQPLAWSSRPRPEGVKLPSIATRIVAFLQILLLPWRLIMRKSVVLAAAGAAFALSSSQPALAQADVDQQLGNVHFETSCNEAAQRRFDRAMRYQHSFWYEQAKEIFEEAANADPTCAIAQWGIALTLLNNPHSPIPPANLAPGLAAIQKAKQIGAKTERERDYINALAVMYVDHDK